MDCYGAKYGRGHGRHLYRVDGPTCNGYGPDGTGRMVEVCVHCSDSRVVQGPRPKHPPIKAVKPLPAKRRNWWTGR